MFLSKIINELKAALGFCPHNVRSWPRRAADGKDYQICFSCHKKVLSKIQFDKAPSKEETNVR